MLTIAKVEIYTFLHAVASTNSDSLQLVLLIVMCENSNIVLSMFLLVWSAFFRTAFISFVSQVRPDNFQ